MKRNIVLIGLSLLIFTAAVQANLKIDFSRTDGTVEAGWQGYLADHEKADTFTAQTFAAFDANIVVTPTWSEDATPAAMQMISRGENAYPGTHVDLLEDWIGTDGRQPGNPLTITISGLPAGTYHITTFHHDNDDQTGIFNATVNDASGSVTTEGLDISNSNTRAGNMDVALDFASVTTFRSLIVADGNDVSISYQQVYEESSPIAEKFFVMNALELKLASAPVAHWTLDVNDVAIIDINDPYSDILALDVTENGNDGLLEGGLDWVEEPKFGMALEFDGMDDGISVVSDANFIELTQPCSITFWVKTDANDVNNVILTKSNGNDSWDQAEKMVEITSSSSWAHMAKEVPVGAIEFEGSWCNGVGGTTDVTDGVWHHVAITWEGEGTGVMYIDGAEEALSLNEYNGNFADNVGDVLHIGMHDEKGSFTGYLADVRLYDSILSMGEVQDIIAAAPVEELVVEESDEEVEE